MSYLHDLDEIQHELEARFPGWQVWYVPHGAGKGVTWCARPWPLLNSTSPEHLVAEITQAHTESAADWPALASLDDYGRAAPGIPRAGSTQ